MIKILLRFLQVLAFGFLAMNAGASDYYLSAQGNDANDGMSGSAAWKSIEKVNSTKLLPGDRIFFHRGDVFSGELRMGNSGEQGRSIEIGAYGSGAKPVLSGAVPVTSWNLYSNGIYVARQPEAVSAVYLNDSLQCLARYPRTGFNTIKHGDKTSLVDAQGLPPGLDLTGATVRIRAVDWQYEVMKVASQNSNSITFTGKMKYQCNPGFGYFLDNKLDFLDSPGEWFYDSSSKSLYFIPPNEVKLSDARVEATIMDCGLMIETGVSNVLIHDLDFEKYKTAAINGMENSSWIAISNCVIRNIGVYGINLDLNTGHYLISNNQIEDVSGRAISTLESSDDNICGNDIRRIGLYPGYGYEGVNNATGIAVIKKEKSFSTDQAIIEQLKQKNVPPEVVSRISTMAGFSYSDNTALLNALAAKLGKADASRFSALVVQLVKNEAQAKSKLESSHNRVAYNVIEDTGYVGIRLDGHDNIAECNVLKNTLLKMADGGSLYCWAQNDHYTFSNIFRSNIVINVVGNGEGATNSHPLTCGIYLDNKTHHITVEDNILINTGLGIFVNDQGYDQQITGNTCYNNISGLTFNEYLQRGSMTGSRVHDNILFATDIQQSPLLYWSILQDNFRPVISEDNNLYGGPGPAFIRYKYFKNGTECTNDFTLPQWKQFYGMDEHSKSITASQSIIFIDDKPFARTFEVPNHEEYRDLKGEAIGKKITLQPFTSQILIQK
ncbi:MAG TPA: hypothetical protein VMH87_02155 [Pseudomonadales bacterium]|nr:hypothetical protein [Pseudomonadales bacterium]